MYPVKQYFLEDCVELCNFVPPPDTRKRKNRDSNNANDDDEEGGGPADEADDDLNKAPLGPGYSETTSKTMPLLNERDVRILN